MANQHFCTFYDWQEVKPLGKWQFVPGCLWVQETKQVNCLRLNEDLNSCSFCPPWMPAAASTSVKAVSQILLNLKKLVKISTLTQSKHIIATKKLVVLSSAFPICSQHDITWRNITWIWNNCHICGKGSDRCIAAPFRVGETHLPQKCGSGMPCRGQEVQVQWQWKNLWNLLMWINITYYYFCVFLLVLWNLCMPVTFPLSDVAAILIALDWNVAAQTNIALEVQSVTSQ